MNKQIVKILSLVLMILSAAAVVLWQIFFSDSTSYYLVSVIILLVSMIPFLLTYERSMPSARELALIAVLIAIAVASRAVFYLIPQSIYKFRFHPVSYFPPHRIWTPFQMVALGLVGFVAGWLFKRIKINKWSLSIIGFLLSFALYGIIVDTSSVIFLADDFTIASAIAVYAAGVPFSTIFGAATAIFLFLFGKEFIKRLNRIIVKYGILEDKDEK